MPFLKLIPAEKKVEGDKTADINFSIALNFQKKIQGGIKFGNGLLDCERRTILGAKSKPLGGYSTGNASGSATDSSTIGELSFSNKDI